jgi:hypothetical protein
MAPASEGSQFQGSRWTASRLAPLALVLAFSIAAFAYLLSPLPLGVLGEWVWNRSQDPPANPLRWILAAPAAAALISLVVFGWRILDSRGALCEVGLLAGLLLSTALFQFALLDVPNPGYGLERWPPSLVLESTSGYFAVARTLDDPERFLAEYADWVGQADVFHLGTHPPGLILFNRRLLDFFDERPELSRRLVEAAPRRLRDGVAATPATPGLTYSEQAAVFAAAAAAWAASLLAAAPIYLLARLGASASQAWLAASLWLCSPATLLFLPVADSLYAFLAASVVLLLSLAQHLRIAIFAVLAGLALWLGMMLSAAFLAVAFWATAAMLLAAWRGGRRLQPFWLAACLTAGFALPCEWIAANFDLNLLEVWKINLEKHSAFYREAPRTYWKWAIVDLVEFAIVAGPAAALAVLRIPASLRRPSAPVDHVVVAGFATLLLLDASGRNLGEVARLWLFLTPAVHLAGARLLASTRARPPVSASVVPLTLFAQILTTCLLIGWVEPLLPAPPASAP